MIPKAFSGLMFLLFITADVYPQLNEFIITPQPAPAVIPVFTSHPDKAAIIIYSAIEGIQYESNTEGIFKELTDDASGTVTLIVYPEKQFIKVKKRGFLEGLIKISQLEQRQVLYYKIEPKTQIIDLLPVTIISDPEGADIFIDGEFRGNSQTYELPPGEHKVKVLKEGFGATDTIINVSKQEVYFKIKLQKVEPVLLTIKSDPKDATVIINDLNEGTTDLQLFKMPGTYRVKIIKSGFQIIEDEIVLSPDTPAQRSYNMTRNTGILNLTVDPNDSKVYINNKEVNSLTEIALAPGSYKISASRHGYFSREELILIEMGQTVNKAFILDARTGNLQLIVKPIEATGELVYEGKIMKSFTGSQMIKNLREGDYELRLKSAGYKTVTELIAVRLNETTNITIQMEKGQDLTAIPIPGNFVFVQGGTFEQGGRNFVTLSDFYIGKYEVTQRLWKSVMGHNPSGFIGNADLPVENVSWYEAIDFCNKLSEMEGLQKVYSGSSITMNMNANGYRLPTEAEWEYAARGGSLSKGFDFSGSDNEDDVAWYSSNSDSKTHTVGQKQPNELGIYDMSGNVWEWCWDWYGKYSSDSPTNPTGPESGRYRVYRGGSWSNYAGNLRPENRYNSDPDSRYTNMGFRLVRSN